MASSKSNLSVFLAVLLLLVLLPLFAKGDAIPPVLSPYLDKVCKDAECGKGHCNSAPGYPFGFKCECEVGWKRTRFQDQDHLQFLPCVIPNCSLDYSCMPAAPPAPAIPFNLSFFDPCYWIYCGEGTCTKNSTHRYSCSCDPGHQNLLNTTAFPCYSECALGSNCATLGIRIRSRGSSFIPGVSSTSSSTSSSKNQATLLLPRKLHWITILLLSLAMAIWK